MNKHIHIDVQRGMPWWKAMLVCLPMMVLTFVLLSGGKAVTGWEKQVAMAVTFLFFNGLFFMTLKDGRTDRWRAPAFILYALLLSFTFIVHMLEARGAMSLSEAKLLECQVPFCHVVIPMTLVPIALKQSIIFPGQIVGGYASISSMFVIWITACLVMGRGFCSWLCFFGGWDDGFSRWAKKPRLRNIPPILKWMPFAVLLVVVLSAAVFLEPTYCAWLCPFKAVTEYEAVVNVRALLQTIVFVSLFVGLVIVIPILTKRRAQCGLFCPMGALTSFSNKINAFDVRIDTERCVKCGLCARNCPVFALSDETIAKGRAAMTCVKCGKCIDVCPKQAISYHIKGTPPGWRVRFTRVLFLYITFLFLTVFAGGTFVEAIRRLLNLITTGSLFY